MACFTTPTYTIHMNGNDYGYFEGGKGLTQGDLLSPLLFVMVMKYLSRLYKRASMEQGFKFHPECRRSKLMHLMFANDFIVFSLTEPKTVQHIMEAFRKFSQSTGLEANKAKSQVMVVGCREDQKQRIKDIT